nr:MAG TPA: Protein of unknown function (DUF2800) [Caudoviricetes sp.]
MKFLDHSSLEGKHAFLGASKNSWLRYDDDKVLKTYRNARAAAIGTKLHEIAAEHIQLGLPFGDTVNTVGMFVNDAIRYSMTPEQVLYYSPYAFGTADAISFDPEKELLRIHDLKTGVGPTKFEQLEIYAALFCLEYSISPTINVHLRIYQNGEVRLHNPDPDDIRDIMHRIVHFSNILDLEDQC